MENVVSPMKAIDRARRGDARAIEVMLARKLQVRNIHAIVRLHDRGLLELRLDSARSLPEVEMMDWLRRWFKALKAPMVKELRVYAWRPKQPFPAWLGETTIEVPSASEAAALLRSTLPGTMDDDVPSPELPAGATMPDPPTFAALEIEAGEEWSVDAETGDHNDLGRFTESQTGGDAGVSTLDLAGVPETDRLAYYGALYAIAHADGEIDEREAAAIEAIVDLSGLSVGARERLASYRTKPPALVDCLACLAEADESLRFGLMVNLVDTSWADEELDPMEFAALKLAQRSLNISDTEMQTIEGVVREMRALEDRPFGSFASADLSSSGSF